ncbi:GNAT family N-acetyltransferase [Camelliibacillus cellulosilyticus]|uniref:GNAT family N-acetyltransferase n=1 Tax=Camelliibacillus cellulosilyticus TaxID=2174486 RepID=A0ABV9GJD6_9BACL
MTIQINELASSEKEAYLKLCHKIDRESKFLLYEPEERDLSELHASGPHAAIFLAKEGVQPVGFATVQGNGRQRTKHRATIAIGLLKAHQKRGVGKQLLLEAVTWASMRNISRLECAVMATNKSALWLFSTMGFNVEGIRRNAVVVGEQYIDEFYMAKWIELNRK